MNEIDSLKRQISELKKENQKLKQELEVFKLTKGTTVSLDQYYFNKYLENYEEIKNTRLNEIEKELNELENQLNILNEEIKKMDSYATLNEAYQLEIAAIKNKKDENIKKLEELENQCNGFNKQLKEKQELLKNATIGYYKTIIKHMDAGTNLVLDNIEFVMEQLKVQLYSLVLECRNDYFTYLKMANELEELKVTLNKENEELDHALEELLVKIKNTSALEISTIKDGIINAINQRIRLKTELLDTFNKCKERDLKLITDKINFYQISKKPVAEITNLLEALVKSLCDELKSQESFNNLHVTKEIRLSTLINQKEALEDVKKRYDELKEKERIFYKIYVDVSKRYDMLVDFLDNTIMTIKENEYFYQVMITYNNLKQEITEITTQYKIVENNILKLEQEYLNKSSQKHSSNELKILNSDIAKQNSEKNRLGEVLRNLNDELRNLEQNHKNIELLSVIKDKEYVESRINKLYQSLRKLKTQINKVREELLTLEESYKEYELLLAQIKELTDDLNN